MFKRSTHFLGDLRCEHIESQQIDVCNYFYENLAVAGLQQSRSGRTYFEGAFASVSELNFYKIKCLRLRSLRAWSQFVFSVPRWNLLC